MRLTDKQKTTINAQRTLSIFYDSLYQLLQEMPFEKISVSDICQRSQIPRATFYNYFLDKYDLLDYFYEVVTEKMHSVDVLEDPHEDFSSATLDLMLSYVEENIDLMRTMVTLNENSYFMNHLRERQGKALYRILSTTSLADYSIPLELSTQLLADTCVSLCIWWIKNYNSCSRQQILSYYHAIFRGIN